MKRPFGRGPTTPVRDNPRSWGLTITIVFNHILTGMTLQAGGSSKVYTSSHGCCFGTCPKTVQADEVTCAHGAALTQLDPEEVNLRCFSGENVFVVWGILGCPRKCW